MKSEPGISLRVLTADLNPVEVGIRPCTASRDHRFGLPGTDDIAAHRDQRLDALGPEKSQKVHVSGTLVKSTHDRFIDLECIHEADGIGCDGRRLSVARRRGGEKPRFAVAS